MKKIQLQPGKRYKGYAVLNEYGEINFTPSQVGSKPDMKKIVCEEDDFTVYETKNFIITSIKIPKEMDFFKRVVKFLNISEQIVSKFRKYEI